MESNDLLIQDFSSQIPLFNEFIQQFLCKSKKKMIDLAEEEVENELLFKAEEHKILDLISINQFSELLVSKWKQELLYQREIIQLKDSICNEFEGFTSKFSDKSMIIQLRNNREKIINLIFELTKFDEKLEASHFCTNFLNGLHAECYEKFDFIVFYVCLKPLLVPFPIKILEVTKNLLRNKTNEIDKHRIDIITQQIMKKVQDHFKENKAKISDFPTVRKLTAYLQKLTQERKVCSILIDDINSFLPIIKEFHTKCIEEIHARCSLSDLVNEKLNLCYDAIDFIKAIESKDIQILFEKVSKTIKALNIFFNIIEDHDAKKIGICLSRLSLLREINLNFSESKISDIGIRSLSSAIENLKNLQKLILYFCDNNIGDEGIGFLSNIFYSNKNISYFHLDICNYHGGLNKVSDPGVNLLANGLKELNKLTHLTLDFSENFLTEKSVKLIVAALGCLKNLMHLELFFRQNNLNDGEEISSIASYLTNQQALNYVELDIRFNKITSKYQQEIEVALKNKLNFKYQYWCKIQFSQLNSFFLLFDNHKLFNSTNYWK